MKLDKTIQDKLLEYIKAGNYVVTACEAVGIAEKTYYNWIKKGKEVEEKAENGIQLTEEEANYLQFLQAIKKAKAEAIVKNVLVIQIAARKNWQAAAWWLERTNYKDWGRKDFMKIDSNTTIRNSSLESLEKLLKNVPKDKILDIAKEFGNKILDAINGNRKTDKAV